MNKRINSLKRLFKAILTSLKVVWKAAPGLFLVRLLNEIVLAVLSSVVAYLFAEVIDRSVEAINGAPVKYAFIATAVYAAVSIFSHLLPIIDSNFLRRVTMRVSRYIDESLMGKLAGLSVAVYDDPETQDTLKLVLDNRTGIDVLSFECLSIIGSAVRVMAAFLLLLTFSPIAAILVIGLCVPYFIVNNKYVEVFYEFDEDNSQNMRKTSYIKSLFCEPATAYDVRVCVGFAKTLQDRYSMLRRDLFDEKQTILRNLNWKNLIFSNLFLLAVGYTFAVSVQSVSKGALELGSVYYYVSLALLISESMKRLFRQATDINTFSHTILRYRTFMDMPSETQTDEGVDVRELESIEFRDVGFCYPNTDNWVLRHLNVTVQKGEHIALVGKNGCGKTTIVKLLLRLYDVTEGMLLINGRDIRCYERSVLRKLFGVLPQEVNGYSFTFGENISMAEAYDEALCGQSMDFAGVRTLHAEMERGLDTPLTKRFDENGRELSVGQWQRIALARAFYRQADCMVLDEPSASLDAEAEYALFNNSMKLCENRTMVLISHRLSNVRLADRIIVIEDGRVIEDGAHAELMTENGVYANLFRLQASKYSNEEKKRKENDGFTVVEA